MAKRRTRRRASFTINPLLLGMCVILVLILVGLAVNPVATVLVVAAVVVTSVYLWQRYRMRRRLRVKTLGELLALTPAQFEKAVGDLLHDIGYRQVRRVGGPGDLAADLWCRDDKGRSVVVQCKRYAPGHRVGSRDIQSFIGMVHVHHQADRGLFVTTSDFTRPALELAHQHRIMLADGPMLTDLLQASHRREQGSVILHSSESNGW